MRHALMRYITHKRRYIKCSIQYDSNVCLILFHLASDLGHGRSGTIPPFHGSPILQRRTRGHLHVRRHLHEDISELVGVAGWIKILLHSRQFTKNSRWLVVWCQTIHGIDSISYIVFQVHFIPYFLNICSTDISSTTATD